jgi:hypothetical protein
MPKVIIGNSEIEVKSIRAHGQNSIAFVLPETGVDAEDFADVKSLTYEDDNGKKEKFTGLTFNSVLCDVAPPAETESEIESTPTSTEETTVIFDTAEVIENPREII